MDYIDQLKDDRKESGIRIDKLTAFMDSSAFMALTEESQSLLDQQFSLMYDCHEILVKRIKLAKESK